MTLFSHRNDDMTVTRINGHNVSYFKMQPFPNLDLRREKEIKNAQDSRKDISYFTMGNDSVSTIGNMEF